MAEVRGTAQGIIIELDTVEKLGALSGNVEVPWGSIGRVERVDVARKRVSGFRAPGTSWPGRIALGTWRSRGAKRFVAAYGSEPGYVIDLRDHRFDQIIVSSPPIPALDERKSA